MTRYCGFCGKSEDEVARLIDGPATAACNECIVLMHGMLSDPEREAAAVEPVDGNALEEMIAKELRGRGWTVSPPAT